MATQLSPKTPSPRVKFLADARFLIGVALVLASIAAVWFVVTAGRTSTPLLQANRTIVVGEPVRASDFRVVEASMGTAHELYLSPGTLGDARIAARTITSGELVPMTAVADAATARHTTIVVPLDATLAVAVTKGSTIDLWRAAPEPDSRALASPTLLVAGVTVNSRDDQKGVVGKASTMLELTIAREDVPAVLGALTDGSVLSAVPASGGILEPESPDAEPSETDAAEVDG